MPKTLSKEFPCRECGATVTWAVSKTGSKYLAQPKHWHGDDFGTERVYLPSHGCVPNEAYKAARAAQTAWEDQLKAAHQDGADAPQGRVKGVQGTIVKIVNKGEGMGFDEWKMTVQTEDGWRAWMTVPKAFIKYGTGIYSHESTTTLAVGDQVTFDATLVVSERDPKFAFGKRPVVATR